MTGEAAVARGETIWLRPLEESDLAEVVAGYNLAELTHHSGDRVPWGTESLLKWYREDVIPRHGKQAFYFAICRLGDERLIGTITLGGLNWKARRGEFGVQIQDEALWGHGYGTDAVNALVDYAFGYLGLERLQLTVADYNPRGLRSYEKSGFVREGVLRHSFRRRHGMADLILMSMLRPEWEALKRKRSWDYL